MTNSIYEFVWYLFHVILYKIYLILRHLPLMKCPACKGNGGRVSGYYEPEWSECEWCWPCYERLEDYGINWAVGRLSPIKWLYAWFFTLTSHYSLIGWLKCKAGFHDWTQWGDVEDFKFCSRCWKDKE